MAQNTRSFFDSKSLIDEELELVGTKVQFTNGSIVEIAFKKPKSKSMKQALLEKYGNSLARYVDRTGRFQEVANAKDSAIDKAVKSLDSENGYRLAMHNFNNAMSKGNLSGKELPKLLDDAQKEVDELEKQFSAFVKEARAEIKRRRDAIKGL